MRFVVLENSGGGIFRFIKSTSGIPEEKLERYFCVNDLPQIADIAEAYGIDTMTVADMDQLRSGMQWLAERSDFPRLLVVSTPPKESAEVLTRYFNKRSTN